MQEVRYYDSTDGIGRVESGTETEERSTNLSGIDLNSFSWLQRGKYHGWYL
jgi:hypothetical protein